MVMTLKEQGKVPADFDYDKAFPDRISRNDPKDADYFRDDDEKIQVKVEYPSNNGISVSRNKTIDTRKYPDIDKKVLRNLVAKPDPQGGVTKAENEFGTFYFDSGPSQDNPFGVNGGFQGVNEDGETYEYQQKYWGHVQEHSDKGKYLPGWATTATMLHGAGYDIPDWKGGVGVRDQQGIGDSFYRDHAVGASMAERLGFQTFKRGGSPLNPKGGGGGTPPPGGGAPPPGGGTPPPDPLLPPPGGGTPPPGGQQPPPQPPPLDYGPSPVPPPGHGDYGDRPPQGSGHDATPYRQPVYNYDSQFGSALQNFLAGGIDTSGYMPSNTGSFWDRYTSWLSGGG